METKDFVLGFAAGKAQGGGGGDVPLLSKDQWIALSPAQKRSYGLVAIQDVLSGYIRGELLNGGDYIGYMVQSGTGPSNAVLTDTINYSGDFLLIVLSINSENSNYQQNIDVKINGASIAGETLIYNTSGATSDNQRNYRLNKYNVNVTANQTIRIEVTNTNSFSSIIWALLEASSLSVLDKAMSKADQISSGANTNDGFALYGTSNSRNGGNITLDTYSAGTIVTTANPGTNYKSSYIFWFTL